MNLMRGFVAFRPTALLVLTLALTVFASGCVGTASTPTPTPTPAPTPTAGLNLSSLAFTSQMIGTASMAQMLTLTNSGKGPLSITSITIGGTNSSDFSETNTCATSLAANANCVISVTFTPTGNGVRSASLTITDNAAGSPQTISLSGMAAAPAIVVNVSPGTANVQAGTGTQSFSATLQNDSQNKGVNWTLSGTGCSGNACGMLSASSSASGAAITYTAPTTVPNPGTVILTATSVADSTKSAAATITITAAPPAIAVTVLPATPISVQTGGGQNFTATVQNDSQNKGVTWSLSGDGCSGAACGTVSAASSASGAPITYTAPANVPSPATITLTATSAADSTKSAETTITVTAAPGAIAVSVSPMSVSVPTNGSQDFTATVQNDAQNKGVTWMLLGASCGESTCGTLSATSSASGVAITYTAPANVPTPESVTLRATAVANGTKSAAAIITVTAAPPAPVNIGNITSGAPVMVLEANGNIDLAWGDDANGLFFSRSTDGGATFSTPKVFGGTNGRLVALQMAADGAGNINILSWGPGLEPNGPTTFRRSTDGGATFSPPVELAAHIGWQPQLAVDPSGTIDIAWIELTLSDGSTFAPNPIVRFTRSTDGVNFSTPVVAATVLGSSPTADTLRTAVGSQGQFYMFWEGNCGVSFVRTLDGGQTFSPITPIPASQVCDISTKLTLDNVFVDSSDNINVTLTGPNLSQPPGSNVNLYFSRSTDQGSNFFLLTSVSNPVQSSTIDPINPSSDARFDEGFQQIAVEPNGDIDIVWTELLSANAVLFARSTDGGNSFTIPTVLSHNLKLQGVQSSAGNPAVISSQSGIVSVVWDDDGSTVGIPDVFFSQSANDQAFPTPIDVSSVTGKPGAIPRMAVDPHGNVYLVWGTFFVRVPAP
jgi:Abnormal spindle-like microcephaly-assoc'd, ASPM-SPD-2-Hydin